MADTASVEAIRAMLLMIVQAIVDKPEETVILTLDQDGATCFWLRVAQCDFGKVIGEQGCMARSIRKVLAAASMRNGHKFTLDIGEEGVTSRKGNRMPQRFSGPDPTASMSLRASVRGTAKRSQLLN